MAKIGPLRQRQVHLDFHTSPFIPDVGKDFDAREFARMFKKAHVDSVTVFAKCHHGHLYYETKRAERHPNLRKGLNLLGEQVEVLHREGIRAPIYISVQCDEYAANTHPEWVCRRVDGTAVAPKPLTRDFYQWQILDMASPYQEYLAEQTAEILKKFKPVDGVFFDMCWNQFSVSKWAIAEMKKWNGNPESVEDRIKHARNVSLAYMKRFYEMVKGKSRDASVYFNSRPLAELPVDSKYLTQVEIEALPSGGWGYMYFPKTVRFVRTFDLPYMGMTARFHRNWADFGGIKPRAALEYETSQMMAHGAACSIGDQLHPSGKLDRAVYELIGEIYERVEEREPWLVDAKPVAQIGVVRVPTPAEASVGTAHATGGAEEGAVRMLTQIKQQFDLISPTADFGNYELIILPDAIVVDTAMAKRLDGFIKAGGAVLASGMSGMNLDASGVNWPALGVKALGMSPFTATYIRFGSSIAEGVAATDHVMYERGVRVSAMKGSKVLAEVIEPYFERTWEHFSSHAQTPAPMGGKSDYPAAVQKGRVGYIAYPIFAAYATYGNIPYRQLVEKMIKRLLPEPLVEVDGPSSMEVTLTRQKTPGGTRTIVHLLQYCAERRTANLDLIEDVVPVYDVMMSVKLSRKPKAVYVAPSREEIDFTWADGRATLMAPEVNGHAMVVFE
jgi:Hypothetical glycosyl hydrolase 6/Beta-galactosidase trimerisation domain